MEQNTRIWVAGHRGMVGSALCRGLAGFGYYNVITTNLDLRDRYAVEHYVELERPKLIIMAAGRVGGIKANNERPVDFLDTNLTIGFNVVRAAQLSGAHIIYLGSTCIYPRECPQPMKVEHLWSGPLEPTNCWYATAKLSVIRLIQAFGKDATHLRLPATVLIPCNLYGPNDNYDPDSSHVIPALFSKIYDSKRYGYPSVQLLGTGVAMREFMHVDDLVRAAVTVMRSGDAGHGIFNVGSGDEIAIRELAQLIADVVGFKGEIRFAKDGMDGMPRKICDSSAMQALGWQAEIGLEHGLKMVWDRIEHRMDERRLGGYRL